MNNRTINLFLGLILLISLAGLVYGLDLDREERINFGHVLRIKEIFTEPLAISPGGKGILNIKLQNIANFDIYDVRLKLNLPTGIHLLNDISTIKISKLGPNEIEDLKYQLIISPTASEGLYELSYSLDYLNNVGDEREDIDNFTIIVKSTPNIFVKIENSEVYKRSYTGDINFKFVNNELADIKFLTVDLQKSLDYDIISSSKGYIGDLNSDDFESISFRIKVLNEDKKVIVFPLKLTYKDALDNSYEQILEANLTMRSASELGKSRGSNYKMIIVIVIIFLVIYFIYKRHKKKTHAIIHHHHK